MRLAPGAGSAGAGGGLESQSIEELQRDVGLFPAVAWFHAMKRHKVKRQL
jgi:hypothetical protein